MVVPERSVSGATCLNFRVAVGDDGGTERSFAERHFPNSQIRVVGGVSGGTSGACGATFSKLST